MNFFSTILIILNFHSFDQSKMTKEQPAASSSSCRPTVLKDDPDSPQLINQRPQLPERFGRSVLQYICNEDQCLCVMCNPRGRIIEERWNPTECEVARTQIALRKLRFEEDHAPRACECSKCKPDPSKMDEECEIKKHRSDIANVIMNEARCNIFDAAACFMNHESDKSEVDHEASRAISLAVRHKYIGSPGDLDGMARIFVLDVKIKTEETWAMLKTIFNSEAEDFNLFHATRAIQTSKFIKFESRIGSILVGEFNPSEPQSNVREVMRQSWWTLTNPAGLNKQYQELITTIIEKQHRGEQLETGIIIFGS